jgi:hypothetical protein
VNWNTVAFALFDCYFRLRTQMLAQNEIALCFLYACHGVAQSGENVHP